MQQKKKQQPQQKSRQTPPEGPIEGIGKWDADELGQQASMLDEDGILRKMRRGDESRGDPDDRDAAGGPELIDTPHGREESKRARTYRHPARTRRI